jgi:hypothetical protein
MSERESDKDSVGFINGRPARVAPDGKITYLDEEPKKPAPVKKPTTPTSPIVKWGRITVGIVILVGIIKFGIIPFFETGGGMADTRAVPGDPTHFDPIANYAVIKAYAGEGALLTEFDAYYVHSDGTLDLTADYYPRVSTSFVIPTTAPADAPPVGAGGSTTGQWYIPVDIDIFQPGQWRKVSSNRVSYTYVNKGMQRDVDDPTSSQQTILADPTCSFAGLWEEAIKHDAPESAVAIIGYDESGYHFSISDVSISLDFDTECQFAGGHVGSTYFDMPTLAAPSTP